MEVGGLQALLRARKVLMDEVFGAWESNGQPLGCSWRKGRVSRDSHSEVQKLQKCDLPRVYGQSPVRGVRPMVAVTTSAP